MLEVYRLVFCHGPPCRCGVLLYIRHRLRQCDVFSAEMRLPLSLISSRGPPCRRCWLFSSARVDAKKFSHVITRKFCEQKRGTSFQAFKLSSLPALQPSSRRCLARVGYVIGLSRSRQSCQNLYGLWQDPTRRRVPPNLCYYHSSH